MTSIVPKFENGPVTYEVSAVVRAGRLVAPSTGGKIAEAGAGVATCLGVATTDATNVAPGTTTDAFGNQLTSMDPIDQYTSVGGSNRTYTVTYAADATFGALLKTAAAGTVTPWITGTDSPGLIVGRCTEPLGVVVATKATGLAKITV